MKIASFPKSLAALALFLGAFLPINAFHAPANRLLQRQTLTYSAFTSVTPQSNRQNDRNAALTHPKPPTNTALPSAAANEDPYASPQLDTDALTKYVTAGVTELTLFGATFKLLDAALAAALSEAQLPLPAIAFVFYAASLKSRVFNPLNNQRPDLAKAAKGGEEAASNGFRDRVMPSWTPPGVIFPIMWILIIGPLRAYSAALVVSSTGTFFSLPIMAFMLHLTVGDVWNTINNTEKRYGAAVVGVACVVVSAANAAYQYSTVDPLAGKLLGGTLLWLVTAAALITDTWRLNPTENGEKVPLYPVKGEAETSFLWGAATEE
eukprot:CAMPEP_0183704022 /NCGR_PEP_ID=MMETSP0737-20130205/1518_1 /TAXON_ID=385413 /ORGANISM="Thalassiosira miniscula, Strain CCMP1093" /LENGTH=321 /DNA_ID=CAMNT_0025930829 /DNA_START=13 /DNA_END=978 /DNA_ORIENTATION=+